MDAPFALRLKSARIQAGATQADLAAAIGVSKQAISQYENGRKSPESSTLLAIANYFGKPVGYFFQTRTIQLDRVDFRKRARLQGRALAAIKASILDRLEPYLELEQILNIDDPFVNPIAPLPVSKLEQAEGAAIALLQAWNLGTNPIPNLIEMLEDRGVKVVEVTANAQFDGMSTLLDNAVPVIVVNQAMDTLRKRFTVLHELGHLLLAVPDPSDHAFCEKVCNRFAAAMLLPADVFRAEVGMRRSQISLAELIPIKEYYGISLAAIVYRGLDLGVFTQSLGRRFWQMRNQNPALKVEEGYGYYPGEEKSYRFEQLLSKALALELISYSKAAQLANTNVQALRQQHQLV